VKIGDMEIKSLKGGHLQRKDKDKLCDGKNVGELRSIKPDLKKYTYSLALS